jgi:cyclic pyranopterin monophosphate synthase
MVDVSHKSVTIRSATARARVQLPPAVFALVEPQGGDTPAEIRGKKGPVFAAAIIAGTMAVKKTPELIPFCHPLPVEHVHVDISVDDEHDHSVRVSCTVRTTGKTGVEMEALTGASLAALCIYDMLKALSHDIVIADLRLDAKSGGKSDFTREFVGGNPDK